MLAYLFWSCAALFGAALIVKQLCNLSVRKLSFNMRAFYVVMHTLLLSGGIIMALELFNVTLNWQAKIILAGVLLLHNSFVCWQLYKYEKN